MTTRVPHSMIGLQPSGGDDRAQILAVASDTKGGRVMWPKMVPGNSTGGLFFFSSGNSNCATDYATDGGTTNTAAGTVTQITIP